MNELHFNYWQLPRELELLLKLCLRQNIGQLPEDLDWDYFDALVQQHRIQPLLIRGIRQLEAGAEGYPRLMRYRGMQNQYAMESMNRLQALGAVNASFADAGIPMIAMKGPMLSVELYGDPSMRTSRDLDVMVAQEDMERAGKLLESMGYVQPADHFAATPLRRKYHSLIELEKHEIYQKGEICVELHWRSNFQAEQSFRALWQRREERMLLGRPIAVMGHEDRYPALIIHAAEHGFLRLRWLLDLYELQKKADFSWERVLSAMMEQNVGELALETMLVLHRLKLPGLKDICLEGIRLRAGETGVTMEFGDTLAGTAQRAGRLSDAVCPLLLRDVQRGDVEWKRYDRLLPTCINEKTPLQWFLIVFGPSVYDFALIDLPDWLFWLYFLIRPINWVRRKLFGGK